MGVILIGCGHMGEAMLRRWLECDSLPGVTYIIKPTPLPDDLMEHRNIRWTDRLESLDPSRVDYVLFAVKPNIMGEVLQQAARFFNVYRPVYFTIAAGLRLAYYESYLGSEATIIRAMPNMPVMLGEGVTTFVANQTLSTVCHGMLHQLFETLGMASWLEDEAHMDLATAIAGSGPAYSYLFMESLIDAGIAKGLDAELARRLVIHSMSGAAHMTKHFPDTPIHELRQHITSKAGTTEAALQQYQKNDALHQLSLHAVEAAIERAKALAEPIQKNSA